MLEFVALSDKGLTSVARWWAQYGSRARSWRDDASLVLARDPTLASARGQALRHLLYLFERDEAVRLIRAG